MKTENSFLHSQDQAASSEALRNVSYHGMFCCEELLAPFHKRKLEVHPLSAVRYSLYNIFAATLYNWKSFLRL